MLPTDIRNLIMSFHDHFNLIEKKRKINFIIKQSYQKWLTDAGFSSLFFCTSERDCKLEIYPYISGKIFISNITCWNYFLNYFKNCEQNLNKHTECRLPSLYSLF